MRNRCLKHENDLIQTVLRTYKKNSFFCLFVRMKIEEKWWFTYANLEINLTTLWKKNDGEKLSSHNIAFFLKKIIVSPKNKRKWNVNHTPATALSSHKHEKKIEWGNLSEALSNLSHMIQQHSRLFE